MKKLAMKIWFKSQYVKNRAKSLMFCEAGTTTTKIILEIVIVVVIIILILFWDEIWELISELNKKRNNFVDDAGFTSAA